MAYKCNAMCIDWDESLVDEFKPKHKKIVYTNKCLMKQRAWNIFG